LRPLRIAGEDLYRIMSQVRYGNFAAIWTDRKPIYLLDLLLNSYLGL